MKTIDIRHFITLVLALVLSGCASAGAANAQLKVTPLTFSSDRYAYSITYIGEEWLLTETEQDWPHDTALLAWNPGTDTYSARPSTDVIVIAGQVADITLAQWTDLQLQNIHELTDTCDPPEITEEITLDGEPAVLNAFHCSNGHYLIYVTTVHDVMAYLMTWRSSNGDETDDVADFKQFLSTFTFTE